MGERLNLEIKKDGKLLANAYYHWSGYTSSALNLIEIVLNAIPTVKEENPVFEAIRLLEATSAGLTPDEKAYAERTLEGFDPNQFKNAIDRNEGLISISQSGMKNTRRWEESRATLDLATETIRFDVCHKYSKSSYCFEVEMTEEEYLEIPCISQDISNFSFSEFQGIKNVVLDLVENKKYEYRKEDGTVYSFIE